MSAGRGKSSRTRRLDCWFLPRSPTGIAAGLARLIGNEDFRRTLALNGKRFVHQNFNFARRVAREESLYREILAERQR